MVGEDFDCELFVDDDYVLISEIHLINEAF